MKIRREYDLKDKITLHRLHITTECPLEDNFLGPLKFLGQPADNGVHSYAYKRGKWTLSVKETIQRGGGKE
jgi:hypothetical protein